MNVCLCVQVCSLCFLTMVIKEFPNTPPPPPKKKTTTTPHTHKKQKKNPKNQQTLKPRKQKEEAIY